MAKLPQSLDMPAPSGTTARGEALDFSSLDNALQGAARQIERVDESRRQADEAVAGRIVEEVRQGYAGAAEARAYGYDGRQPGYAEAELKHFDDHFAVLDRAELPDGVRMAVGRQLRDLRARTGAAVISTEARTRGQRAAADRDASEQEQAIRALMGVQAAFDQGEDQRRASWDGLTPVADEVRASWRLLGETALGGVSEAVATRLRPMLLSQEASLFARAMASDDESRDARTLTTIGEGLNGLVNRTARDPSLMSRFEAEIQPILEAAPAALRQRLKDETWQAATTAALDARIQRGEFDAVEAEIARGRHDRLDARALDRLRAGVASAKANGVVADAQRAADLEAGIAADLRNILSGQAPNAALATEARLIGGEPLATKVRLDQAAAQNVRPLMARLRTMTPQQAEAELERLTAGATDAEGARTLELARAMITQDRAARADGAAWAATPTGPGDRVGETVRDRLRAFSAAPSPETAAAYASATWIAQREGGVPLASRRILTAALAENWVEGLDVDGDPGAGLTGLAAKIGLFGPDYAPQVTRELALAGLKSADLGALTHYAASPRRMSLYVQARGEALNKLVPEKAARERLDRELDAALRPYLTILASREGGQAALEAAKATAYGMVSRGENPADAVRTATAPMTDGWDFQETWAIPRTAGLNAGRARTAAARTVEGLLRDRGAGLATPPSARYTPEQARRNYADVVRSTAQWRNLTDGSGIELVTPSADGSRWMRVQDAAGRDVVRTWSDLDRGGTVVSGGRR